MIFDEMLPRRRPGTRLPRSTTDLIPAFGHPDWIRAAVGVTTWSDDRRTLVRLRALLREM